MTPGGDGCELVLLLVFAALPMARPTARRGRPDTDERCALVLRACIGPGPTASGMTGSEPVDGCRCRVDVSGELPDAGVKVGVSIGESGPGMCDSGDSGLPPPKGEFQPLPLPGLLFTLSDE